MDDLSPERREALRRGAQKLYRRGGEEEGIRHYLAMRLSERDLITGRYRCAILLVFSRPEVVLILPPLPKVLFSGSPPWVV